MTLIDMTRKILHEGAICDHCLGRQFAKLSTGLSNDQRGAALKLVSSMHAGAEKDEELKGLLARSSGEIKCWVCNDLFLDIDAWVKKSVEALSDNEYSNFLVGTKVTGLLAENEEILWAA